MGLDMYLSAERYLSEYDKNDAHILEHVNKLPLPSKPGRIKTIRCEAAYWRKANAIHKWFVDNVQNGEDKCKPHFVSREQLHKLLDTVNQVLADRSLASELLPTEAGFFFGSTEYDEWYWHNLEITRDQLTKCLQADDHWTFEYQSSW